MKIYTYSNPFKLKEESYWNEISKAPHLCVSQTLVQGLTTPGRNKYDRKDFRYIYTIKSFNEKVYKDWLKNPENDIRQYIYLSEEINKLNDQLRDTFKFNQREIYNALRLLIESRIKPHEIKKGYSDEMDIFVDIYKNLYSYDCWNILDKISLDEKK